MCACSNSKNRKESNFNLCSSCKEDVSADRKNIEKLINDIFLTHLGIQAEAYRQLNQLKCIHISIWALINIIEKSYFLGKCHGQMKPI
jgi:hydroxymethylglutaryl-CoA reductase